MAGVFFCDETHFLAGFQPKLNLISGIGGKPEQRDTCLEETASREMLEELFGLSLGPKAIPFQPERVVENAGYTIFVFSFHDLHKMLRALSEYKSPFYESFPSTLQDLIYKRMDIGQEITRLNLYPFSYTKGLSKDLLSDIKLIHGEQQDSY
jgi:hypothetical protein